MSPLRTIGLRLIDDVRELPYSEGESIRKDPPFPHAYSKSRLDPSNLFRFNRNISHRQLTGAPQESHISYVR
ncbi:hypothetical protein J7I98_22840 [Streptomyces sp. ISL-98]|uniref:hypothetical protein n=1 Tax=Streptomyces sp. ISL-98 TaxID=2819192 RepID=UPI001BE5F567|nr:hypothetical protein [Streptomyces sp. ISL-98]MBT2508667.1 hypothetical protein [Streptomyces sp. ISL-98]